MQKRIRHFGFLERLALTELSSVLLAISMPGMISSIFVWVGLIPFFFAVRGTKWWKATLYGWMLGITFLGISLYWLLPTLTRNISSFDGFPSYLGALAFFVLLSIEGLFWAIFGFSYFWISESKSPWWLKSLSVAGAYVIIEYLRGIGDVGFTGGRLSNALYTQIGIVQLSALGGTLVLVFVIVFMNYLIYKSLCDKNKRLLSLEVGILSFAYIASFLVPHSILQNPIKVGAVQTNISVAQRYQMSEDEILKDVDSSIENLGPKANLILFPEGTFEYTITNDVSSKIKDVLEKYDVSAIIGYPSLSGNKIYNSAGLFTPAGLKGIYSKHILVPFTETLPYPEFFGLFKFLRLTNFFTPGKKYTVFEWKGVKFSIQICFESYFERLSRRFTNEGAQFLATITNDSWFSQKTALEQHFAQSVFRAAENRKWTVQVADSGITGVIDPYGRIIKKFEIQKRELGTFEIEPNDIRTFYDRSGNWINWVSLIFLSMNLAWDIVLKKKNQSRS